MGQGEFRGQSPDGRSTRGGRVELCARVGLVKGTLSLMSQRIPE